jgi:hypothetical protein
VPAGDPEQQAAVDGVADPMELLLEHARHAESMGLPDARVPMSAPAKVWDLQRPPVPASKTPSAPDAEPPAVVCRRCGPALERDALASATGRQINQGWRHTDGRKTHLPDPISRASRLTGGAG